MPADPSHSFPAERPLWGSLQSGPYAVGFRHLFAHDPARVYDLPFGERSPAARARRPRPILLNIWYPAEADERAVPVLYREDLELESQDPQLAGFVQGLLAFNRRVVCSEVMGKPERDLDAAERAAFDAFLETPTAAVKDARATPGAFPLVINHPGLGGAFEDNAVLFEYLASYGYVVVSSAFQSENAANPGTDWDMERSLKDLDFLVRWMGEHVPQIQGQPVGVMGQSYGALAAIGWAAENNSAVAAVVSFDSTLEHVWPGWKIWDPLAARLRRTVNLSAPMLLFARDQPSIGFDHSQGLKYAERYFAKLRHLGHNDFLAHGAIGSDIRRRLDRNPAQTALIRQGYDRVCLYTRQFLDASLKEDPQALDTMRSAVQSDSPDSELLSLGYRPAAPLPPTSKQFLDRMQACGLEETCGFFGGFRDELADRVLEYAADRLLDEGKIDEAVIIARLNTEWCPQSTRAWEELASCYQAKGERELALTACKEAARRVDDDPALSEHERWMRKNGLTESIRELQGD